MSLIPNCRLLPHAASAVLLAWEGTRPEADARRVLLAQMVLDHRLSPSDPLAPEPAGEGAGEAAAIALLLGQAPVPLATAGRIVG